MYFTVEDFNKIERWLQQRTVKDSTFAQIRTPQGNELVSILKDGKNRSMTISDLMKYAVKVGLIVPGIYIEEATSTLEAAINNVPEVNRRRGLLLTFKGNGAWAIYQFIGDSVNDWQDLNNWQLIIQSIDSLRTEFEETANNLKATLIAQLNTFKEQVQKTLTNEFANNTEKIETLSSSFSSYKETLNNAFTAFKAGVDARIERLERHIVGVPLAPDDAIVGISRRIDSLESRLRMLEEQEITGTM